jgi:hypothetical protein
MEAFLISMIGSDISFVIDLFIVTKPAKPSKLFLWWWEACQLAASWRRTVVLSPHAYLWKLYIGFALFC